MNIATKLRIQSAATLIAFLALCGLFYVSMSRGRAVVEQTTAAHADLAAHLSIKADVGIGLWRASEDVLATRPREAATDDDPLGTLCDFLRTRQDTLISEWQ